MIGKVRSLDQADVVHELVEVENNIAQVNETLLRIEKLLKKLISLEQERQR